MTEIYHKYDRTFNQHLLVTGRHKRPITDELLIQYVHNNRQQRSVVLSRADVEELHAALGKWLETGWPGVRRAASGCTHDTLAEAGGIRVCLDCGAPMPKGRR